MFQARISDLRPFQVRPLQPAHPFQVFQASVREIEEQSDRVSSSVSVLEGLSCQHPSASYLPAKALPGGQLPNDACRGIANAARFIAHLRGTQIEPTKVRHSLQVGDALSVILDCTKGRVPQVQSTSANDAGPRPSLPLKRKFSTRRFASPAIRSRMASPRSPSVHSKPLKIGQLG